MRKVAVWMVAMMIASLSASALTTGDAAPAFEVKDSDGKSHKLSDFAGKHVVLEWINPGCPFVQKHYGSGNMQKLQKEWTGKGVVWLTISSAAPGKPGHHASDWWNKFKTDKGMGSTAVIDDASGVVGRAYGAKVTPHMFVIDGSGKLVYQGAIDDKNGTNPAEIAEAKNHVSAALEESMAGKSVTTGQTQPYGCGVKY